jgi:endo-alpha-1,4-polygalactosaminidase (GH114 family)
LKWHTIIFTEGTAMTSPRAFISFQMEDRWARNFLVQQAKDKRNDIAFVDYSVQDPFDSSWKTECTKRIAQTKGTIVLIGATTYQSQAVLWEIAETTRQQHYMFGIQVNRDSTHRIPGGLPAANVIRWDFEQIAKWLATWA